MVTGARQRRDDAWASAGARTAFPFLSRDDVRSGLYGTGGLSHRSHRRRPRFPAVRLITDRSGPTLALEADHRRQAVAEDTIRDLKYGVGLKLGISPSGGR